MARARVWVLLVGAPLVLAIAFAPFIGWFTVHEGLKGEAVVEAVQPVAVFPSVLGFSALLLITRVLARRDGVTLGWSRPNVLELAIGAAVGIVVAVLNQLLLHPLIRSAQPSFDPALPQVSLLAVIVTLLIAVSAEDSLYRGYAFAVLRERHGAPIAGAVTSISYALLTPGGGWPLMAWALAFGVVLFVLRSVSKTLWPVVLAHLLTGLMPKLLATF